MKNDSTNLYNNMQEDSIDIVAILKNIWKERKLIIKTSISFFFIGCFVAILSPTKYTSKTTFVPQVSEDQVISNSSKIGALASSLAGINLNTNEVTSDSYLSPLLYSQIIDSEEFSLNLLNEELINLENEKFTIKEYLLSKESLFNFNPIQFIKKYTIGLFISQKTVNINSDFLKNYNFISEEDYLLIDYFKNIFSIELNEKEGFINVLATDEDAFISAQLVELITKSLQSKIIKIRTNKIKERLEFSKEQYDLKQNEFDFLHKNLAEFKDSNKSISTARFMSELQKLESEFQLQQNILVNLAAEYNNNKIKLNRDTPIFSVIDEVSVPIQRSEPRRSLIVLSYLFIGVISSIGYLLFKEPLIELFKHINEG